jgi:tetrahydromethanopterin S-methyltransferase subunit A
MPRCRFVRPERVTLPISDGDTITIRKRLDNGERRAMFARMYQAGVTPLKVDPMKTGLGMIVAYLVDWTLVDEDGQPVPIADLSADDLAVVIDHLESADFTEIKEAIERHVEADEAALEEKKRMTGALVS